MSLTRTVATLAALVTLIVATASASTIKIVTDSVDDSGSVTFSSADDADTGPAFALNRVASEGSARLQIHEDGDVLMDMYNNTVAVDHTLLVKGKIVAHAGQFAGDGDDDAPKEIDLADQVRILMQKVTSLEDTIARLAPHVDTPDDGGDASACAEIDSAHWAGAGAYYVVVNGEDTVVYCDSGKWTLVVRGTNDRTPTNGNPDAYPTYPVGQPPMSANDFGTPGVFRYHTATIAAMRNDRVLNDLRVRLRKGSGYATTLGDAYFPKTCNLAMDPQSTLPSGDPCYDSYGSPSSTSLEYRGSHQDALPGRWSGPHVNQGAAGTGGGFPPSFGFISYAVHVYPLGSNAGAYCTWTDTRDCVEDSEYTIWIY